MYCEKCGYRLKDGTKFCPKCGWKVSGQKAPDPISGKEKKMVGSSRNENGRTSKSGKKWPWIIVFVIIIAVVGILAALMLQGRKSGEKPSAENVKEQEENQEQPGENKQEQEQNILYSEIYGPLLDQTLGEYDYSEYLIYMVYDIDKNGVLELLLQTGTSEADYVYEVYTIQDESSVYLGELPGGHSVFYADENGGTENYIIRCAAHMSGESVSYVYLENGVLSEEEILSREVPANDTYYSNPYPLEYAYITDKALLDV